MKIKQFLKPDWRKIVIFVIIMILAVISLFNSMVNLPKGGGYVPWTPWSVLALVLDLIIVLFYIELPPILNFLVVPVAIIYWYLLSCFIVWIYDKVKKK